MLFRLTEDDIAFQLQFAEEQEQQSMLNEGAYIQNVASGSTSANNENTANIQKSDNQQNFREAELTNEERSILFKVYPSLDFYASGGLI